MIIELSTPFGDCGSLCAGTTFAERGGSFMEEEKWKPVIGYEGYFVSNFGGFRSERNGRHTLVKQYLNRKGYFVVGLSRGRRMSSKLKAVHKLVAEAFVANPYRYPQVDHLDTVKDNNNAKNLEWVTNAENMRRSWTRGTHHATKGNTRLRPDERFKIAGMIKEGLPQRYIAGKFNVTQATVSKIACGKGPINKNL